MAGKFILYGRWYHLDALFLSNVALVSNLSFPFGYSFVFEVLFWNSKDFSMFNADLFFFVRMLIHTQEKLLLLIRFYISCCTASYIKMLYQGCFWTNSNHVLHVTFAPILKLFSHLIKLQCFVSFCLAIFFLVWLLFVHLFMRCFCTHADFVIDHWADESARW
jgi:hypothetical protein